MTNIGAIKVCDKDKEYLVFVADAMGTVQKVVFGPNGFTINPNGGTKKDDDQKLYRVGNHLVMGSGRVDLIRNTIFSLSEELDNPNSVSEKILEVTDKYSLTEDDYLNFIVGGKDEDGLWVYEVNATGNYKSVNGTADYKKRGLARGDFCFLGSGSKFVEDYVQGCNAAGKSLVPSGLEEGLVLAYEFGKKGAKDSGVNDKLQYGILSSNGISRLYHPDVNLVSQKAFHEYLNEMTKVDLPLINNETPEKEAIKISQKRTDLVKILRNVYTSLDLDLKDYSEMRTRYTGYSEAFANDYITIEMLQACKNERTEKREIVKKGAAALLKRGLRNLISYKNNFQKRQKEAEKRALKY